MVFLCSYTVYSFSVQVASEIKMDRSDVSNLSKERQENHELCSLSGCLGRKRLLENCTVGAHNKPRKGGGNKPRKREENDPKELFCLTHTGYLFSRKETLLTRKPNPNLEI